MGEKLTTLAKSNSQKHKLLFMAFFVVILLLIVGCQEKQSDDDVVVATETVVAETAVPPTESAAPDENPEIPAPPPPDGVTLMGDVQIIAGDEAAEIALDVPTNAQANRLDLFGWDGTRWVFIPSQFDAATGQRHAPNQGLVTAVALVQADAPETLTVGGFWREENDSSEELTESVVSTVRLGADGELAGLPADPPDGIANPYLQLTNVDDDIETAGLTALLADEAAQTAQIEAIMTMAEPFAGINLNYQGIEPEQQAAFTTFVQNLAEALAAQGEKLTLTLPAPQDTGGLDEQWIVLGDIADTVYLQLPLDPQAYGEDGTVDQMLTWATDNIDRRKLVALIPTDPVAMSGDSFTVLSAAEQLGHFGELAFVDEAEEFMPETPVEVMLSGDVSPIEWDETAVAYHYTVDGEDVWLVHPATVAARMETAVAHNLQGVAFTAPIQPFVFEETNSPSIVWSLFDEDGNGVATQIGFETTFSWEGAADPGEFMLQVDFLVGQTYSSLGTLPITVAAAEEAEEVAESDEAVVTATGILKVNAYVRVGPGESYTKFPGVLLKDSEIEILGRDEFGYWFYIVFENFDEEQNGWIAASLVNLDPEFEISSLEDASDSVATAPDTVVAEAPVNETVPETTTPAPTPASGPPPPVSAPPVAVGGFELGGQTHSFSNPVLMASAGMNWVKFQHKWGEGGNPNDLAGRINNAHAAGFKVLLSIPGANTYPDHINFGEYVQFLAGVAALGPDAIEVWNEMNIDFEWPAGQIDPASYVNNMLAPAYNAIKAANPNVMVISGAPAPTGFDNGTNAWADNRYMSGMLAAGGASYADCIGAHYNAGASSPSTVSGHPTGSAHYSWYLLPTLNVYAQLGKPVCFTELGYLSGEDYGGVPERFGWAAGTTVAQHAAWLAEAVSVAANTGRVRLIIVFNVDFTQWGDDPQAGYAMIRKNGGCPACETLARVMGR
ncbi:MAG: hypothetical protein KC449_14485 [Anaerolineales bacterium]|nr:hypothetical protein [Anaerolineales bacterium]